ncbi:BglG family transcription antiterminator [Clostridium sp. ZS2-4]|uniref:BglG family transcription antiterminator n=1 Tax=Clostridium sp. ZS2-4 TaxID=2987703 RepID=UPI00227A67E6|nr:BglG family transcription antiterminator [Clostridium sp. ZS2-4]MCY6354446.1 BglG family transcription antiterminator [Clostridium sp. ZS2-4]
MIKERTLGIVKYLYSQHGRFISSNELSEAIGVSSRTIKRGIKDLIIECDDKGYKILSSNKGYCLNVFDKTLFLKNFNIKSSKKLDEVKASNKNRVILNALILVLKDYVTTDEISEKLYVSRSTVSKDIGEVKRVLKSYNIQLLNKPYYGYFTEGKEDDKRRFIVSYLEEVLLKNTEYFEEINGIKLVEYEVIKKHITKILVKNNIFKPDNHLNLIQRYVYVNIIRLMNNKQIKLDESEKITLDLKTINTAKEITNFISCKVNREISMDELVYTSFVIGNSYLDNSLCLTNEELILKDTNLLDLINKFMLQIKKVMKLDFTNDFQLINGLFAHINSSLGRYSIKTTLDNPMLEIIKTKYIESYNCALLCNEVIKEELLLMLSENDIGYIALHFAAAMERRQGSISKICVICENGIGFSQLIKSKLEEKISNIQIVNTIPRYMLTSLEKNEYDLIVTTVNLEENYTDIPIVRINYDLDETDILNIKTAIDNSNIIKSFFYKIPKELFFANADYESKEELMHHVLNIMLEKEYLSETEIKDIMKREELSETVINNVVALPHCIKTGNSTGAIITLKRPVLWGSKEVRLVIISCINPKIGIEKRLFPLINNKTKSNKKIEKLVNSRDLEEFCVNLTR